MRRPCFHVAFPLAAALAASPALAHPSLYFDAAGLEQLEQRAASTTDSGLGWNFAEAFEGIKAAADQYVATPYAYTVQIPDPDGVGSVTWTYALSSSMPPAHPNNPNYPPWTRVSRDLQSRMETLSFVYAVTGEPSYWTNAQGTGALDVARAVVAWSQWTDPGYSCGGANSCLDTAHLTLGVGMAYDLGFGAMTAADRTLFRNAIVSKGVEPLVADVSKANAAAGGIAAWFNGYALRVGGLAVGACAVQEDIPSQASAWTALARESILGFYDAQGDDGGAFEGQLYGSYAVDNLVIGAHVLDQKSLGADLFDHAWLAGIPRFASAFLSSDNRSLAPLGDSSAAAYWSTTMFSLASRGDAAAQWYLVATGNDRPRGFMNFIWARPDLQPLPIQGSGSSLYKDVGHAVLRAGFDGAPVVAIKSGPPTTKVGHNHLDHNSFVISAFGQWIAADPGYENYFNASKHLLTTGTIGHNSVLVDKTVSSNGATVTGGQTELAGGTLDYLFDGSAYAKVVAQAAATYPSGLLSRFGRRIFYARPDVVFVFDDIAAASSHGYSFLLHTGAAGRFEAGTGPAEMVASMNAARLQAFFASSAPLAAGYPTSTLHPGAEEYGPYAEWRTQPITSVRFAAALVPGRQAHVTFDNPGFEDDLTSWQPRFDDGSHAGDDTVARSGQSSARIQFSSSKSGYFYSEPMSLTPGSTITASVYARGSGATGTIGLQSYYMLNGSYIAEPAGDQVTLPVESASDWTHLTLTTAAPASGVDSVRIAIQFTGTGTVWFDDASYEVDGVLEETPLSKAVALGDPHAGLVVSGPFGIEAAASMLGSGQTAPFTLSPASADIPEVPDVTTDADLFVFGLTTEGSLARAYLQNGTFLDVGGATLVTASAASSFDLSVRRDGSGCVRVDATEVATLEAPPYGVGVVADEVYLAGERVAFEVQGEMTTFPQGTDLGPGCEPQDAGTSDGSGPDGGVPSDASLWDGQSDGATESGHSSGAKSADEGSGCACRTEGGVPARRSAGPVALLLIALALCMTRGRRVLAPLLAP